MIHSRYNIKKLISPLLATIIPMFLQTPLFAQQNNSPNAQQKIETLKIAYLTRQLNLSPQEAQKFWPVYNQYQKDMRQLVRKRKQNQINKNELDNASDKQIEQSLDRDFNLQQQALKLREQYREKFRQAIPPRKVMELYKSEKDFNMKLIKELRRRQGTEGQRHKGMQQHSERRPSQMKTDGKP